jgi:hypothetical protein
MATTNDRVIEEALSFPYKLGYAKNSNVSKTNNNFKNMIRLNA